MHLLFTYGTLQNKDIQLSLFKRILTGNNTSLLGYQTGSIVLGNTTYPILTPSNNKKLPIQGTCYQINDQELLICDEYEGEEYKRILVTLESKQKAWVYVSA